jgi:hypothetical protein
VSVCRSSSKTSFFHWKEESQHAILDELEWRHLDAGFSVEAQDAAADEPIALVGAVDAIARGQALADSDYFARACGRDLSPPELCIAQHTVLDAYLFQYILSGAGHPQFASTLASMTTDAQLERIHAALASICRQR